MQSISLCLERKGFAHVSILAFSFESLHEIDTCWWPIHQLSEFALQALEDGSNRATSLYMTVQVSVALSVVLLGRLTPVSGDEDTRALCCHTKFAPPCL